MLVHVPDHFSSNLKFSFSKLPAFKTDRSSPVKAIISSLLGIGLLCLGIFELFSFLNAEKSTSNSYLLVEIFAFIIILIALGIIIGSILAIVRYKKFTFNGKEFKIIYRPSIGVKHTLVEPLENYIGVRLRVLFSNTGLFNKNRYIVDLYHQDASKIVPLYISTQNKNIRKIWENYARLFRLPALSVNERGLCKRDYEDLNKPLKQLALENKLPHIANGKFPAPQTLNIIDTSTSTIIKPLGVYWDVFSSLFLLIAISASLLLTIGGVYLTVIGTTLPIKYWVMGAATLFAIIYFTVKLFETYYIELAHDKLYVKTILFGTVTGEKYIDDNKIENIELTYNPAIDRYSLAVISKNKILSIENRLPVNDLLWLKDFITRKIIGN